ncbi:universal stress family protein [Collimonas arenae]|uniref:Universal stress family protein n=1 Tax=Collimonas arenae TaxID=279058 RepID=A0A0A1FFJ7_9BURK|nr:universal stress family protein [Collimonas arenae]
MLNVQDTCESPRVHAYYSRKKLLAFEEAAGDKALLAAQHLLAEAGVNYVSRVETGPIAQTITSYAEAQGCDAIVMGTSGHGAITSLIVGNVSIKVIHLTDIPVTLVK